MKQGLSVLVGIDFILFTTFPTGQGRVVLRFLGISLR